MGSIQSNMSIELCAIDINKWSYERISQPTKHKNIKYVTDLNYIITTAIKDLNVEGKIYYKNGDTVDSITGKYLYYNYGSPAPWLCKLLPEGYGFLHFEPNDLYKTIKPEIGIQSKLLALYEKGLFTRYTQPTIKSDVKLPDKFILVAMQNVGSTVWYRKNFTKLAEEIVAWSRENKKNVVFKWHNGCIDHNNPQKWFDDLTQKSNYASIDYTTPLYSLIKQCDMFWSASSMAGIEALICNKPVSVFGETEYMEMATVCNSPEEAINAKVPVDLEQWFTYYIRNYCINIYAKDAIDRIRNRTETYFSRDITLNEFILL